MCLIVCTALDADICAQNYTLEIKICLHDEDDDDDEYVNKETVVFMELILIKCFHSKI